MQYSDIVSVEVGRTLLLDGLGIHMSIRGGWVLAADCVVVHFRNGGTLRIGTDDAENLAGFLERKRSAAKDVEILKERTIADINVGIRPRFLLPYLRLNKVCDGTIHACFDFGFRERGRVFLAQEQKPDQTSAPPGLRVFSASSIAPHVVCPEASWRDGRSRRDQRA